MGDPSGFFISLMNYHGEKLGWEEYLRKANNYYN
jgi:hypothetical protein